jgi:hypothetical protein
MIFKEKRFLAGVRRSSGTADVVSVLVAPGTNARVSFFLSVHIFLSLIITETSRIRKEYFSIYTFHNEYFT